MPNNNKLQLKFSHNIIEHLGLKLYQNKPTNVISELISNSWDADAANVWIDIQQKYMSVADDGIGMSHDVLANNYLVIGKRKRFGDNLASRTKKMRLPMGRKGIGKLAPFGIAKKITVVTVSALTMKCCWFEIELESLLSDSTDEAPKNEIYTPVIVCDEVAIADIPIPDNPEHPVSQFLSKISEKGHGTLILMEGLSTKKLVSAKQLISSIGQRFTVTLLDDDFSIFVNSQKATIEESLPQFAFRSPTEGFKTEIVNLGGIEREIRHWVGFVEHASWPQDQSGVGIYAHGKIGQDRPFVFGLKGKEIFTRYMFGIVEADWLDELEDDVISTDRTNIDWNHEHTVDFYQWGQGLVSSWIAEFRRHQKETNQERLLEKLELLPETQKISNPERHVIKDMVLAMSPRVQKDEALQDEVLTTLTSAWTHRPVRAIINALWDRLEDASDNEQEFLSILSDIHKHLVPESLSLSVTVAQKIYALTKLYELSLNGTETQLQALLESFPWILGSDYGKVSANISLKELAREASEMGILPAHGYNKKELAEQPDSGTRPDFCFFTNDNYSICVVVELKSPQIPLEYRHLSQLQVYINWMKSNYPNAQVSGMLIGKNTGNGVSDDSPSITITNWDMVVLRSRKDYLELLATMLNGIPEDLADSRVQDVFSFGGTAIKELLGRLSSANPILGEFLGKIDKRIDG